jgi:radical SAM superfamily enzyme
MNKRYSLKEVQRTCNLLRRFGIRSIGFLLLGGPGETKETVEQSLNFADFLDIDMLKISVGIRIYPETDLARRARSEGLISSDNDLLMPRFYLNRSLENWLLETIEKQISLHPTWMF